LKKVLIRRVRSTVKTPSVMLSRIVQHGMLSSPLRQDAVPVAPALFLWLFLFVMVLFFSL